MKNLSPDSKKFMRALLVYLVWTLAISSLCLVLSIVPELTTKLCLVGSIALSISLTRMPFVIRILVDKNKRKLLIGASAILNCFVIAAVYLQSPVLGAYLLFSTVALFATSIICLLLIRRFVV